MIAIIIIIKYYYNLPLKGD